MYMNATLILSVFLIVFISLLIQLRKFWEERFEIFGVLVYASFVIVLSLKELGITFVNSSDFHQFTAMLFFPFQCLFMSIHIFKKEDERKRSAEKALIELKINQQRELDKRILEVEENEKKRIAQNIHDEIGSIFVSLKYRIQSIREKWSINVPKQEFDDLTKLSEQGIRSQYSIIDDLLLDLKSGKCLKETIENHINLIVSKKGIEVEFKFISDESKWNDFQKSQVFRIISELLANAIKHAQASSIRLAIKGDKDLTIDYFDNGHGFNPELNNEGRGLSNIRTRVNVLKGKIEISSNQNGTRFEIEIPFDHD
jgi:two-component system NarL family sensor kinase